MGRFVKKEPVKVTVEGSDDWVAIKPKLSLKDREALNGTLYAWYRDEDGGGFKADFDPSRRIRALLKLAVVDWSITDDGEPVPFSLDLIDFVDSDDPLWDEVAAEIARRNPTLIP